MSENQSPEYNQVYAPEVLEFVRHVNSYCQWLEECDTSPGMTFIQDGVKSLPAIYSSVLALPKFEPQLEEGNERYVTEHQWSEIYQKVLRLLGPHNAYLRAAGEDEFDRSDLLSHTISEDLADLYQDLKDFAMQYRQGVEELMNDALWEVVSHFEEHWGTKLLNSLHALHQLYIHRIDPEKDETRDFQGDAGEVPRYNTGFFRKFQDQNEDDDVSEPD